MLEACGSGTYEPQDRNKFNELEEITVREFKLEGELSRNEIEISGLAWYKDYLVILPQFPYKFGNGLNGVVYFIDKSELYKQINLGFNLPLPYRKVDLEAFGLEKFNTEGSGYEGVTFIKDNAYFTIEAYQGDGTYGCLVAGKVDTAENKIILDALSLQTIIPEKPMDNMAYETVTHFNDRLITIFEANGRLVNDNPVAHVFTVGLGERYKIGMPNIEYRITDAASVEEDSTFWVINYMWSGDQKLLKPADDVIFEKYGVGKSQKNILGVERLLKLKYTGNSLEVAETPPLYLHLPGTSQSRNWEGLVKIDNAGFIIATDKYPRTILAFVPFSQN